MKRIVYMGTPEYANVILKELIETDTIDVVLVLTQPDKPVGRKRVITPPPVKVTATKAGIEVLQPHTLKESSIIERIKESNPDYIVVAAYGQLLPKDVLDIAPCINLHASLLPLYRGASPVQEAILNGDKVSGVTAMLMEEGLDSGPILAWGIRELDKKTTTSILMQDLTYDAAKLIIDVLNRYEMLQPIIQTKAVSTHCKKIKRVDGEIELSDANEVYRKYRAYKGWPDIFLANGLKFLEISLADDSKCTSRAGEIVDIGKESITVSCNRGAIEIFQLQPKSKNKMSAKAFVVGRGLGVGDSII